MKEKENIMLSEHFSLREMTRSGAAVRLGIVNEATPIIIMRLRELCVNVLEPLRRRFGVIRITSGYRCERLNKAVGGVRNSQHLRGEAADIHIGSIAEGRRLLRYIVANLDYDQVLLERIHDNGAGWLHVSFCADRRKNRHISNENYVVKKG